MATNTSIITPQPAFTFGPLDLLGNDTSGLFWFETLGDSHDLGSPVPIETEIDSFLQNGAILNVDTFGNRQMTINVIVCGKTSDGLAQGEQALLGQCYKQNTMVWTPPDVTGPGTPSVFDVQTATPDPTFNDMLELNSLQRLWKVTIKALPFARSQNLQTITKAAPSTTATTTLVDAATSTSNWTGRYVNPVGASSVAVSVVSGGVQATYTAPGNGNVSVFVKRSGLSQSMTSSPYVRIDFSGWFDDGTGISYPPLSSFSVYINGTLVAATASSGTVGWYLCPGSTLTSVEVGVGLGVTTGTQITVRNADISRSDQPFDGTQSAHQCFRSLALKGSAPTEGFLSLADTTGTSLGLTIVHTVPSDYVGAQPNLRKWLLAGPTETVATSFISGKYSDLNQTGVPHVFSIPASQIPDGGYALWAYLRSAVDVVVPITWSAKTRMGSTDFAEQWSVSNVTLAAGVWTAVPIAGLKLPPAKAGSAGFVRISMSTNIATAVLMDEAWIFNTDVGQLTVIDAGTGTPAAGGNANRLWLDPANIASDAPAAYIGTAADRSDSIYPSALQSFEEHRFTPPLTNVFTVTSNSIAAGLTLNYYPRFHTHAVA